MALPAPRVYGFPGCNYGPSRTPYVTVENLPRHEMVIQDMRIHMDIHLRLAGVPVVKRDKAERLDDCIPKEALTGGKEALTGGKKALTGGRIRKKLQGQDPRGWEVAS